MKLSRISKEALAQVIHLAHIHVTEEEREQLHRDLERLLEAAAKVQEVDTTGVEPMYRPIPLHNVMRPDENRPSLPQDKVLQNAPEVQNGFFRVPRILD